jgi:hypothetical protein
MISMGETKILFPGVAQKTRYAMFWPLTMVVGLIISSRLLNLLDLSTPFVFLLGTSLLLQRCPSKNCVLFFVRGKVDQGCQPDSASSARPNLGVVDPSRVPVE